jgi:hypothetical protein
LGPYFDAYAELVRVLERARGHHSPLDFSKTDISTWKHDIAKLAGAPFAFSHCDLAIGQLLAETMGRKHSFEISNLSSKIKKRLSSGIITDNFPIRIPKTNSMIRKANGICLKE